MQTKSFLKWAGGKSKLVPFIEGSLPKCPRKRLIEPFAGSAALSLTLEFESYLLNDSNADLIGLFQTLKEEKQYFIDYTRSLFLPKNNQETRFYELREQFNQSTDRHERSALFVYLNRYAFNGLCRYNSKGEFNVPFGRYKSPYFPEKEMQGFISKSARIELFCEDFQTILKQVGKDDMVYCDPPYAPLDDIASFTSYAQNSFNREDQKRLAQTAWQIANISQGVLISNHDTEFTREIYKNARLKTINVQRNIAAKSSSRKKVRELLAIYD